MALTDNASYWERLVSRSYTSSSINTTTARKIANQFANSRLQPNWKYFQKRGILPNDARTRYKPGVRTNIDYKWKYRAGWDSKLEALNRMNASFPGGKGNAAYKFGIISRPGAAGIHSMDAINTKTYFTRRAMMENRPAYGATGPRGRAYAFGSSIGDNIIDGLKSVFGIKEAPFLGTKKYRVAKGRFETSRVVSGEAQAIRDYERLTAKYAAKKAPAVAAKGVTGTPLRFNRPTGKLGGSNFKAGALGVAIMAASVVIPLAAAAVASKKTIDDRYNNNGKMITPPVQTYGPGYETAATKYNLEKNMQNRQPGPHAASTEGLSLSMYTLRHRGYL